ncbi:hypothetical protein OESDEN_02346 [Oesophagostomum dentatum]|uniref:Uncharacterized protein n=1 Tax=Oesophagostomum dentatum TaxID=61180 RepID=A0A0B1TNM9_OESDE|nr:hypothetical protein OESDEN_02346 [Oesophagostomum dentatum]
MFPLAGIFLAEVLNFIPKIGGKNLSDEERATMKEVLLKKTVTSNEDILEFAIRNRNIQKSAE